MGNYVHVLTHIDMDGTLETIMKRNYKYSWYEYKNNIKLLGAISKDINNSN